MSQETKRPTIFYGWYVVAACFLTTIAFGETFWTFGVFFKPLENEFGWSRALVSSGFTAFALGYAVSVITSGRLVDRYSPRPILLVCAIITGGGIALCSQTHNINQFRAFCLMAGLGAGASWTVPVTTVQRWFYRREKAGLALAVVVTGVGVGALIFAPLINYLVLSYGWRNAFLITGGLFLTILVIPSLVIKPSPTHTIAVTEGEGSEPGLTSVPGWTTGKAVTNAAFISIVFVFCVGILVFQVLTVHLVPYATDVGISPTTAAAAMGLMGGFTIPGRIMSGLISDRLSWQKTLAFSLFASALAMIWLFPLKATWMLYCFVFCYGVCHGARIPAQAGILGEFFGMRSLGELIGITSATAHLVSAFAPYVAGFIFDKTGSYFIAIVLMIVLLLISGLVAMLIKQPPATPE